MKKLFAVLTATALLTACNDTETTTTTTESDTTRAELTADSLIAAEKMKADTALKALDSMTMKADTTMKAKDSTDK